jgi:hypothetical protein
MFIMQENRAQSTQLTGGGRRKLAHSLALPAGTPPVLCRSMLACFHLATYLCRTDLYLFNKSYYGLQVVTVASDGRMTDGLERVCKEAVMA